VQQRICVAGGKAKNGERKYSTPKGPRRGKAKIG
jgi:hypothetical protein